MSHPAKPAPLPSHGPALITLCDDSGRSFSCEVLDILDFEERQYCLLQQVPDDSDEDGKIVLMRLITHDDHSQFQTLDKAEFQRVNAHLLAGLRSLH
jgi:uncharacterized protein YrzB (UPF0473 family)